MCTVFILSKQWYFVVQMRPEDLLKGKAIFVMNDVPEM